MPGRPLTELIDPGWARALEPVAADIARMGEFLRAEVASGRGYLPSGDDVLRALTRPFDDVRVLIVGQDPYPTPGHAMGLSFSVQPDVRPRDGGAWRRRRPPGSAISGTRRTRRSRNRPRFRGPFSRSLPSCRSHS